MNEKIESMIPTITKYKNKILIGVGVFVVIAIVFIGFTYGRYIPDPNSEIIQKLLNDKLSEEKIKYDKIIKDKDEQNKIIQNKLEDSRNINLNYQKEISKLKKQLINIKPPENEKEVRERFKDLGYETY